MAEPKNVIVAISYWLWICCFYVPSFSCRPSCIFCWFDIHFLFLSSLGYSNWSAVRTCTGTICHFSGWYIKNHRLQVVLIFIWLNWNHRILSVYLQSLVYFFYFFHREQQKKLLALEMDLAAARQEGFLVKHSRESNETKAPLVVIGVITRFGRKNNRDAIRKAWMGTGNALCFPVLKFIHYSFIQLLRLGVCMPHRIKKEKSGLRMKNSVRKAHYGEKTFYFCDSAICCCTFLLWEQMSSLLSVRFIWKYSLCLCAFESFLKAAFTEWSELRSSFICRCFFEKNGESEGHNC